MQSILIGIGATAVMDLWALALRRLTGLPSLDYAMVGRWLGHMREGQFVHARIADARAVAGERVIGWAAHYATGVVFAGVLIAVCGPGWLDAPTLAPALIAGIMTVAAPFLIMQPGLGLGIAASRTPRPNLARLRSLVTHAVFGFGLFVAAAVLAPFAQH